VVATRGSLHGLAAVAQDGADGAAAHLRHHSGVYNAPFARAVLRGRSPTLIHLWRREQGLLLPAGNPRTITDIRHVQHLRIGKRSPGTGTRVLLDQALTDAGLAPDELAGPELGSHLEVALAVAAGAVHTGLAVRAAAVDLDLEFLSVAREDFDLVLPATALGAAAPLIAACTTPPSATPSPPWAATTCPEPAPSTDSTELPHRSPVVVGPCARRVVPPRLSVPCRRRGRNGSRSRFRRPRRRGGGPRWGSARSSRRPGRTTSATQRCSGNHVRSSSRR
jgi:molybdate-binding protein